MRSSTIRAELQSNICQVWSVVADNANTQWRSDLSKVEILEDGNSFIEYTHKGHWTKFTITCKEPCFCYEFDMENPHFRGHWKGLFFETKAQGTRIEFSETLYIKNPLIELISYLAMPLKKIQKQYVLDLKKALGEI